MEFPTHYRLWPAGFVASDLIGMRKADYCINTRYSLWDDITGALTGCGVPKAASGWRDAKGAASEDCALVRVGGEVYSGSVPSIAPMFLGRRDIDLPGLVGWRVRLREVITGLAFALEDRPDTSYSVIVTSPV